MYCSYYQASIPRATTGLFVAMLRAHEHLCFDRTYDVENGTFEFFVPLGLEKTFEHFMTGMCSKKIVTMFQRMPNRLAETVHNF